MVADAHDTVVVQALRDWDNIIYVSDPKLDLELLDRIVSLSNQNLSTDLIPEERTFFEVRKINALNDLGIAYQNYSAYELALNNYYQVLTYYEGKNDTARIAMAGVVLSALSHFSWKLFTAPIESDSAPRASTTDNDIFNPDVSHRASPVPRRLSTPCCSPKLSQR